jgi:hypothetical protein
MEARARAVVLGIGVLALKQTDRECGDVNVFETTGIG